MDTMLAPCPIRMVTVSTVLLNLGLCWLIWAVGSLDVSAFFVGVHVYPFPICLRRFNRSHQNILATSLIIGAAGAIFKIAWPYRFWSWGPAG